MVQRGPDYWLLHRGMDGQRRYFLAPLDATSVDETTPAKGLGDAALWVDPRGRVLTNKLRFVDPRSGKSVALETSNVPELGKRWVGLLGGFPGLKHDGRPILTLGDRYLLFMDPDLASVRAQRVAAKIYRAVAIADDRIYLITERGLERAVVGKDGSELLFPR